MVKKNKGQNKGLNVIRQLEGALSLIESPLKNWCDTVESSVDEENGCATVLASFGGHEYLIGYDGEMIWLNQGNESRYQQSVHKVAALPNYVAQVTYIMRN